MDGPLTRHDADVSLAAIAPIRSLATFAMPTTRTRERADEPQLEGRFSPVKYNFNYPPSFLSFVTVQSCLNVVLCILHSEDRAVPHVSFASFGALFGGC